MRNVVIGGILLIGLATLANGQTNLDTGSITVTATRVMDIPPDQFIFSVYLMSTSQTDVNSVLAAVRGLGISADELVGVTGFADSGLQWSFNLPVPISQIAPTVAALTTLQETMKRSKSGFAL